MKPKSTARTRLAKGLAVAAVAALVSLGAALASDHQDSPNVELNPLQDLTDVYAFPSPTDARMGLVFATRPFLTPPAPWTQRRPSRRPSRHPAPRASWNWGDRWRRRCRERWGTPSRPSSPRSR